MHLGGFGQGQAESAAACKQINDMSRSTDGCAHGTDQRRLAMGCRLQKRAGWWRNLGRAEPLHRRGAHRDHLALPRQAGKAKTVAQMRQFLP